MRSQEKQKRPISPQQLFQKLFKGNFKQIQCIDEVSQVKQERQILISLISQYRIEIQRRMQQYQKLEKLVTVRNRLRVDLESLRSERVSIDRNTQYEIEKNKLSAVEVSQYQQWRVEMQQIRHKNYALQARLRQLVEYCMKIQRQNSLLQKQNQMVSEQFVYRARAHSDIVSGYQEHYSGWRDKINARRMRQEKLNMNMRLKVQQKEERSLLQAKKIEAEIDERNRMRMASFKQRFRPLY